MNKIKKCGTMIDITMVSTTVRTRYSCPFCDADFVLESVWEKDEGDSVKSVESSCSHWSGISEGEGRPEPVFMVSLGEYEVCPGPGDGVEQPSNTRDISFEEAGAINSAARSVHRLASEKGWWDDERPISQCLALVHSEVSECLEELREGNDACYYDDEGKPSGWLIELADVVIRVMDLAGECGLDLGEAISMKHEYNKTRPHKHNKEF